VTRLRASGEPVDTDRRLVDELDCSHALASVIATRRVTDPQRAARRLSPSTEDIHDPGGLHDLEDRTRPGERPET